MPTLEKTLIILKPDAVKRALIGVVFETFENAGLKLLTAKMLKPNADVIKRHYPGTTEWITEMGEKTLASLAKSGVDPVQKMGTSDPVKLGSFVYERLVKYWQEGPLVVSVWEGPAAIVVARKLRGHTIPLLAEAGTVLGQYSFDSSLLSAEADRVVKTFVHASGSVEEADREIAYWFPDADLRNYPREVDHLYL